MDVLDPGEIKKNKFDNASVTKIVHVQYKLFFSTKVLHTLKDQETDIFNLCNYLIPCRNVLGYRMAGSKATNKR